jgi:hypothetical protein
VAFRSASSGRFSKRMERDSAPESFHLDLGRKDGKIEVIVY